MILSNIRKRVWIVIARCLKNTKEADKTGKGHVIFTMKFEVFKSLFYVAEEKMQARKHSRSTVSKLIQHSADNESEAFTCEFGAVDGALGSLICQKKSGINMLQVESVRA